uniref:Activator of 90 kDa heat shock protein ATPase homolog 1-like n=1 Tax=Hirondellea gigas TaxID=1518452 RepID=A0A2P2I1H8_9CRUS
MAKLGEGDPRWIVEDRPDATNVNNWHWSEKNASGWSKEKLKELLEGVILKKEGLGDVSLTKLSKCDGEATANNRKGKLIFFFEWVLTIDWTCTLDDADAAEAKGTIEIPNLSEENEPHELDVNVTITAGGSSAEAVKTFLRKDGTKQIQDKLGQYMVALREEFAQDLILPTSQNKKSVRKSKTPITSTASTVKTNDTLVHSTTMSLNNVSLGSKVDVRDLSLQHTFKCRVGELYNVFTVTEMVAAFTRNSVKMDVSKGGKFELFGGNIMGNFVKLEAEKQIVQTWRFKSWPDGHYSTVTLDMKEGDDSTELFLTQTNIPASDYERTKEGWRTYYWESIKRTFGFGATLM